jgi:hypothetical protein
VPLLSHILPFPLLQGYRGYWEGAVREKIELLKNLVRFYSRIVKVRPLPSHPDLLQIAPAAHLLKTQETHYLTPPWQNWSSGYNLPVIL